MQIVFGVIQFALLCYYSYYSFFLSATTDIYYLLFSELLEKFNWSWKITTLANEMDKFFKITTFFNEILLLWPLVTLKNAYIPFSWFFVPLITNLASDLQK